MWAARATTWRPESPHGSRLGYLPWFILCGLFWLNSAVWDDVPTIPTLTKRSYHHLATLKHHHHSNEYNVDNNDYNNNVKNTVSATNTQERSISSPHSNGSSIQYHQLSKILFFCNPCQPNHSSLLRTARCGNLPNHRIIAFKQNFYFCLSPHFFNRGFTISKSSSISMFPSLGKRSAYHWIGVLACCSLVPWFIVVLCLII